MVDWRWLNQETGNLKGRWSAGPLQTGCPCGVAPCSQAATVKCSASVRMTSSCSVLVFFPRLTCKRKRSLSISFFSSPPSPSPVLFVLQEAFAPCTLVSSSAVDFMADSIKAIAARFLLSSSASPNILMKESKNTFKKKKSFLDVKSLFSYFQERRNYTSHDPLWSPTNVQTCLCYLVILALQTVTFRSLVGVFPWNWTFVQFSVWKL